MARVSRSCLERELGADINDANANGIPDDEEAQPRQFTDYFCAFAFFVLLGSMAFVWNDASEKGNIDKLTHGFDWQGRICGVDAGVVHSPYTYWCATLSEHITEISDPICVSSCPTKKDHDNGIMYECPGKQMNNDAVTKVEEIDGEMVKMVTISAYRLLDNVTVVPTADYLSYCFPTEDAALLEEILTGTQVGSKTQTILYAMRGVMAGWKFLVIVAIFSFILGFAVLYLLSQFARLIINVISAALFVSLVTLAIYTSMWCLPYIFEDSNYENKVGAIFTDPLAKYLAFGIAGTFHALWIGSLCVWFASARDAIDTACDAIEDANDIVQMMPTLYLQPPIQMLLQGITFIMLCYGMALIVSEGEVETTSSTSVAGISIGGVGRSLTFTEDQYQRMAFWFFGSVWIMETVTAWTQYALAHVVAVYKLNNETDCMPLSRGLGNGFVYHIGTLAFGGFVIGVLKIFTWVIAFIGKQLHDKDGNQNVAVKAMFCCGACCMKCLTDIMTLTNELCYVEVAVTGESYFTASSNVLKMMVSSPATFAIVNWAIKAVKTVGVMSVGLVGTTLAHQVVVYQYDLQGWVSDHGGGALPADAITSLATSGELGITIASGCICFGVGAAFMNLFAKVAQSLAYVTEWKRQVRGDDGLDDGDEMRAYSKARDLETRGGEGAAYQRF